MKQIELGHPLAPFGYQRPPHWLWRTSPRAYVFVSAVKDIWLIVTGRCSLHRAWQAGYDDHSRQIMGEVVAQARRVRNFSDPDQVFEAVPVSQLPGTAERA